MIYYSVGGYTFGISEMLLKSNEWDLFKCCPIEDIVFTVKSVADAQYIHQVKHHFVTFDSHHVMESGKTIMLANSSMTEIQVINSGTAEELNSLLLQIMYSHLVNKNFLQIHSSLVDYEGNGIMFIGPSGIGKTTQAELWQKYTGGKIINGDLVFVEYRNTEFLAWGSPWHGSSPYCLNKCVPLKALVVLKQTQKNRLRLLGGFEKVSAISGNLFYPLWLQNGMDLCMKTFDQLLKTIPVYELSCRPDEDAVTLLWGELTGKGLF